MGREISTLILQPSFLIRTKKKMKQNRKKKLLSTALPAIRERSAAKMCAWGLAFPKMFILLEHRSHLEEFRQAEVPSCSDESQSTRGSRQPGSQGPACPSPSLGRDFFQSQELPSPPIFPFPPPQILGRTLFPAKSCPSHQNPNSSGVQSEAQHGSCHAQGWIKGKLQLLTLGTAGLGGTATHGMGL